MRHSPRFEALVQAARAGVREVTVQDVVQKLQRKEPFRLVDVREDREWAEGHARGAEHMARGILERDVEKCIPDMEAEIVLYCGGGYRSVLSADSLQRMGYRRVCSLAGGWRAWIAAGAPVDHRP